MGELTQSESVSARASDIALEISHALGESLSEIQANWPLNVVRSENFGLNLILNFKLNKI
jgi:hypothetical protein